MHFVQLKLTQGTGGGDKTLAANSEGTGTTYLWCQPFPSILQAQRDAINILEALVPPC
jgi:hypothetical protein